MTKKEPAKETEEEQPETRTTEQNNTINELQEALARTQADYANYRRRTEEQANTQKQQANKDIIKELLDIIDNLTLAIHNTPKQEQHTLYQGVELILSQLLTLLEEQGLQKIETKEFNPAKHEAIIAEHHKTPKGTILEEISPGYTLHNNVLRTSKVKISKGPQQEDKNNE